MSPKLLVLAIGIFAMVSIVSADDEACIEFYERVDEAKNFGELNKIAKNELAFRDDFLNFRIAVYNGRATNSAKKTEFLGKMVIDALDLVSEECQTNRDAIIEEIKSTQKRFEDMEGSMDKKKLTSFLGSDHFAQVNKTIEQIRSCASDGKAENSDCTDETFAELKRQYIEKRDEFMFAVNTQDSMFFTAELNNLNWDYADKVDLTIDSLIDCSTCVVINADRDASDKSKTKAKSNSNSGLKSKNKSNSKSKSKSKSKSRHMNKNKHSFKIGV